MGSGGYTAVGVVFWALLFSILYAGVQAQKAVWKSPAKIGLLKANTIDSVLLDWTSTLPTTILRMWCQNKTDSNNLVLASSFYVESKGPFEYVMEEYLQDKIEFPMECHAELAQEPVGGGTDCPAAILWSSNAAEAAKTVSETIPASSPTVAVTPSKSSTPAPTITPNSTPSLVPPSTANSATTDAPNPTTPPSSTVTEDTTKPPTNTSEKPSSLPTKSSENVSSATTTPVPPAPTAPNNTGAIIGAAIGSVALISFIILAVLFLRKFQRNRASSPTPNESTRRSFYLFNSYNKRGPKARTTGVFEKDGDYGLQAQEKEGSEVSRVYELPESQRERRYSPVELPGSSMHYPPQVRGGQGLENDQRWL
ncbi:hypothetical protein V492_05392 [Pseudogymnoascus sp. VKM F-4246]|nr:hypothetical protein V492_05392 [Pseudogymnoascus sp. VKM F-4246]